MMAQWFRRARQKEKTPTPSAGGESALNVARAMGHSRSMLVDQVYAHSLQLGMASVAQRVPARALGEQPKLRVIEGENTRDIRQSLDETPNETVEKKATA
jgi:HD superfamily phosphohydrolase